MKIANEMAKKRQSSLEKFIAMIQTAANDIASLHNEAKKKHLYPQ